MRRILVEICIESAADARVVASGGGDRVELCSALALGGLTPSIGAVAEVRAAAAGGLPVVAMIRPRPGGFCYDASEFRAMRRDVDAVLAAGADGIVFGVLCEDGAVDRGRSREMVEQVRGAGAGKQIVFHRAFDFTPDPMAALDQLMEMGVDRVLTSGQRGSAAEGAAVIRALVARAGGRIQILPGAGVGPDNVVALVRDTGCDQVHASLREPVVDPSVARRPEIRLSAAGDGSDGNAFAATSGERLVKLVRAVRDWESSQT